MEENKTAIAGYFDITEEELISEYADKHRMTRSEALEALVKKGAGIIDETPKSLMEDRDFDAWRLVAEDGIMAANKLAVQVLERTKELEEQVAYLESELDKIKALQQDENAKYLNDERIAAITGQSEWKVKLWRHGIQKPRGKIIKRKLEAYAVKDGVWVKR